MDRDTYLETRKGISQFVEWCSASVLWGSVPVLQLLWDKFGLHGQATRERKERKRQERMAADEAQRAEVRFACSCAGQSGFVWICITAMVLLAVE